MSKNRLVLEAVKQSEVSKTQRARQKLFAFWFDALVYNQIWEDPRVDIAALEIDLESRILTISSGGCNALNYLIESPKSVTAVDLNRQHIYLLNLKLAALAHLPAHQDFFAFFGHGVHKSNAGNYTRFIAPNLDPETRDFWESSSMLGKVRYGKRINFFKTGGIYENSRNAYFLRFFHSLCHILGYRPEAVLKARTEDQQEELYREHIEPFFESSFVKAIGNMPVTLFGLGIPPQQYDELKKELGTGGSILDVYRERIKRLAVKYPVRENYFAWQAFARKYDTEHRVAIPEYLKTKNYTVLKANAGNLDTKIGSVTETIRQNRRGTFNRFVFLDAQDWMNADAIKELWALIAARGEPGSRIIFRTAGRLSPVENSLPPDLKNRFKYERKSSRELFDRDRASIYGGFHLYILAE